MVTRFAIVCGTNGHSLCLKLPAQFHVVHHIPVVRAHNIPIGIEMRLRVDLRWRAERRPSQLHDPAPAGHICKPVAFCYVIYFTHVFP